MKENKKSKNKPKVATASWRKFEELVARIEHVLSPQGAEIKSPDSLTDKTTGLEREVDASIRYKIGSSEILITIECRERNKVQDVIWIEQLAKKQQDIGASKTIAVSTKGFSEAAMRKAKFYGIEVRKVKKIDDDSISKWTKRVVRSQIKYTITDFNITAKISKEEENQLFTELENYKSEVIDMPIILLLKQAKETTFRDLFQSFLKRSQIEVKSSEIPKDGYTGIYTMNVDIQEDEIRIKTALGNYILIGLNVDFKFYKIEEIGSPITAYTYTNIEENLVEGIEYEFNSPNGPKELFTIHTDLKEGTSKATIWRDDDPI